MSVVAPEVSGYSIDGVQYESGKLYAVGFSYTGQWDTLTTFIDAELLPLGFTISSDNPPVERFYLSKDGKTEVRLLCEVASTNMSLEVTVNP